MSYFVHGIGEFQIQNGGCKMEEVDTGDMSKKRGLNGIELN